MELRTQNKFEAPDPSGMLPATVRQLTGPLALPVAIHGFLQGGEVPGESEAAITVGMCSGGPRRGPVGVT